MNQSSQLENLSVHQNCFTDCGNCGLDAIESMIEHRNDNPAEYVSRFGHYRIYSRFQPIVNPRDKTVFAHEALSRFSLGGQLVGTMEVFQSYTDPFDIVRLDRVNRAMHLRNSVLRQQQGLLFLNLDPRLSQFNDMCGPFFDALLQKYKVDPSRIVIEILESHIEKRVLLSNIVQFFKKQGAAVAIDDFGAGHSNFDRLVDLEPDYIKLDRLFMGKLFQRSNGGRMLQRLVELFHELDARVVAEGVETENEHQLVLESTVDFAQGYYYGRPG